MTSVIVCTVALRLFLLLQIQMIRSRRLLHDSHLMLLSAGLESGVTDGPGRPRIRGLGLLFRAAIRGVTSGFSLGSSRSLLVFCFGVDKDFFVIDSFARRLFERFFIKYFLISSRQLFASDNVLWELCEPSICTLL